MAHGFKSGGRKKGVTNKVTAEMRQHIKSILDATLPKALQWIMEIKDPYKRTEIVVKLIPYIIPKMQELKFDDDAIEKIEVTIKTGNGKAGN